jgi:hypothetical protein
MHFTLQKQSLTKRPALDVAAFHDRAAAAAALPAALLLDLRVVRRA